MSRYRLIMISLVAFVVNVCYSGDISLSGGSRNLQTGGATRDAKTDRGVIYDARCFGYPLNYALASSINRTSTGHRYEIIHPPLNPPLQTGGGIWYVLQAGWEARNIPQTGGAARDAKTDRGVIYDARCFDYPLNYALAGSINRTPAGHRYRTMHPPLNSLHQEKGEYKTSEWIIPTIVTVGVGATIYAIYSIRGR